MAKMPQPYIHKLTFISFQLKLSEIFSSNFVIDLKKYVYSFLWDSRNLSQARTRSYSPMKEHSPQRPFISHLRGDPQREVFLPQRWSYLVKRRSLSQKRRSLSQRKVSSLPQGPISRREASSLSQGRSYLKKRGLFLISGSGAVLSQEGRPPPYLRGSPSSRREVSSLPQGRGSSLRQGQTLPYLRGGLFLTSGADSSLPLRGGLFLTSRPDSYLRQGRTLPYFNARPTLPHVRGGLFLTSGANSSLPQGLTLPYHRGGLFLTSGAYCTLPYVSGELFLISGAYSSLPQGRSSHQTEGASCGTIPSARNQSGLFLPVTTMHKLYMVQFVL